MNAFNLEYRFETKSEIKENTQGIIQGVINVTHSGFKFTRPEISSSVIYLFHVLTKLMFFPMTSLFW